MLKIATGKITKGSGEIVYRGKVIHWSADPTKLHHTPARRASVQETTKWIIDRAEGVGAYRDFSHNRSAQRKFVVVIERGNPLFYNKDELERQVRRYMIYNNMLRALVIDFGTIHKIRGRMRGCITDIRYDRIELMVTQLSYPGGDRIKREKPIPITLKLHKIQRIMYYR